MADLRETAMEVASTIQTAHINPRPSIHHDIAPSTAADTRRRVELADGDAIDSDVDEDEIPVSLLRPTPRKPQLPPLPDLRFEQSYLASISKAEGWQGVLYITLKDQVLMPFFQGVVWNLTVAGWRYWNRASQLSGQTVGARLRRWWWGVNNWKLPANVSR